MSEDSRYSEALRTPSEVYERPVAVLHDDSLDDRQKLEILTHWEAEAVQLQESEAEGMGGGERSLLSEIKRAIAELKSPR
ncbi:MAG TPA: hypothetical protein VFZ51_01760 [Woeseiaceae bacterium]